MRVTGTGLAPQLRRETQNFRRTAVCCFDWVSEDDVRSRADGGEGSAGRRPNRLDFDRLLERALGAFERELNFERDGSFMISNTVTDTFGLMNRWTIQE